MSENTRESKFTPLGKRIIELQGDMTETDLCIQLDLSRNQLYNIKRGKTGTSPETIERMVRVFGLMKRIEIEQLYDLAGFAAPKPSFHSAHHSGVNSFFDKSEEEDFIRLFRTVPSHLHQTVKDFLAVLSNAPINSQPSLDMDRPDQPSKYIYDQETQQLYSLNGELIEDPETIEDFVLNVSSLKIKKDIEQIIQDEENFDALHPEKVIV